MEKLDIINRMIDDATLLQSKMLTGKGSALVAEMRHTLVQLRILLKGFPQDSGTGVPTPPSS